MSELISITKDEINQYPRYIYEGTIVLIETAEDALKAIKELGGHKILGFDTETRAAFKKGESYSISLLQLATPTHAYLFRLNKFEMMPELTAILADESIVKSVGAVRDDIIGLQKLLDFKQANFIDLATLAKEKNIKNFGLRALTAICLKKRLSKNAKISNWELRELTKAQIHYAACDAIVGLEIYHELNSGKYPSN